MTFARNVSALRDTRPRAPRPCVGCNLTVLTADSWGICPGCTEQAWSWIRPRVPGWGVERRIALNGFWSSEQAVREALVALRAELIEPRPLQGHTKRPEPVVS